MTTRRGFTLVEMVLATSLGTMVIIASIGVLGMTSRADTTLARRSTQTIELGTLHGLMQEAFSSLLMSSDARPVADDDGDDADQIIIRPRMILTEDPTTAPLARRAAYAAGGSGRQITRPQVLELVLSTPIAGFGLPADLPDEIVASINETRLASRGVLELRPDDDKNNTWALWWRPVLDDGSPIAPELELYQDRAAVRLAGGLTQLRWQVYHERERKTAFEATWSDDLPAYVELELTTSSGLYANWMFEVGWSSGPETQALPEPEGLADPNDPDAAPGGGFLANGTPGGRAGGGGNRLGPRTGGRTRDGTRPTDRPRPRDSRGTRPEQRDAPEDR